MLPEAHVHPVDLVWVLLWCSYLTQAELQAGVKQKEGF